MVRNIWSQTSLSTDPLFNLRVHDSKSKETFTKELFQQIVAPRDVASFTLPKSLMVSWEDDLMIGESENGCNIQLKVQPLGTESFDDLMSIFSDSPIKSSGLENTINVKKGIWTEKTIFVESDGQIIQYIIALYQDPESSKELRLTIEQPYGSFNDQTLSIIQSLQRSIVL